MRVSAIEAPARARRRRRAGARVTERRPSAVCRRQHNGWPAAQPAADSPCEPRKKKGHGGSGQRRRTSIFLKGIKENPTYAQIHLEADYEDFYGPPTTHLVATVEDLTDALDYASKEHEDMD
ncbi:hypothetical protein ZWY2020_037911, partial [Hordeum vulgare]